MLQTNRRLFFRPERRPTQSLPFCVRSTGHYVLGSDWGGEDRTPQGFSQFFWVERGAGHVWCGGARHEVKAHQVFFYRPGERHQLQASVTPWEYRWLTLWDPFSRAGLATLPSPPDAPWSAGRCPTQDFDALREAVNDPSTIGERRSSTIAYRILVAALSGPLEPDPSHPLISKATDWLRAHFADSRTTIDALADHCQVHRSTLFRSFTEQTGVSPATFLRGLRIQRALRLLRETTLPVSDIAWHAGFNDPNFLARCVRETTGLSPREFRRSRSVDVSA